MLILLYGQDAYRSRQKLKEIIEHYRKAHPEGLNLKYYDGQVDEFEKFSDEFWQITMFGGKKMIVLKNAFLSADFKKKFLKNSKKIIKTDDIILFFEQADIPERDSLKKLIQANGKAQKFSFLTGLNLRNWIKTEAIKYKAVIDSRAIDKLIEFVRQDSWQLSNEIKKLASYALPKKGADSAESVKIEQKNIEELVRPKIEKDIFKTIDAIASQNKKEALMFLRKHLQAGDNPLYLLSMINYQFRNLLLVKSSDRAKLRLHPFVARKSAEQAKKFTLEELKKIYQKIFEADLNIKTGKTEPEIALDLLIAEI